MLFRSKNIGKETIKTILTSLEINIQSETETGMVLAIPPYRVDVKREADVIEEILRIYGYNNVEIPLQVKSSLQVAVKPDPDQLRNLVSEMLTSQGFNEIWANSLTKAEYYEKLPGSNYTVNLVNPLSADLNAMRQTLLFGGMECISWNVNRQNKDLKFYEFGNCYFFKGTELKDQPVRNYHEEEHLGLFVTGAQNAESWTIQQKPASFFYLKAIAENILIRLGYVISQLQLADTQNELFSDGISYVENNKTVLELGIVSKTFLKKFELDNPVYFADFNWGTVVLKQSRHKIIFEELSKFPAVRRDLALIIDTQIKFRQIEELAFKTERKILRKVELFDVYEGKGIPDGKKSYAVSFILRDDLQTLNEKQIDKTMQKLVTSFERVLSAQLRK